MQEIISIIVPVYNTERYLNKCMESLLGQTYKNLEIILIDDNSTDKSKDICNKYREKDDRIIVISNKENIKQGKTRNIGLDIAKGNYIGFVDSDDFIEKDMFELLYSNIKKYNADISICSYRELLEISQKDVLSWKKDDDQIYIYNRIEGLQELIKDKYITNHLWNKIYRKELFDSIRFSEESIMEDAAVMYQLFEKSKCIVYQNTSKYYYLNRKNNTVNDSSKDMLISKEKIVSKKNKFLLEKYPNFKKEILLNTAKYIKSYYDVIIDKNYNDLYQDIQYKTHYTEYKEIYSNYKDDINKNQFNKVGKIECFIFQKNRDLYRFYRKNKNFIKSILTKISGRKK